MDKMREEFEVFMEDYHWSWVSGDQKEELYKVWKASRAALCVNLPKPKECDGAMVLIFDVDEALDDAGVAHK